MRAWTLPDALHWTFSPAPDACFCIAASSDPVVHVTSHTPHNTALRIDHLV
jgi:hypothetical protein